MAPTTRILAVSDDVEEWLWSPAVRRAEPDLIISCGDLPADYLEYLVTVANVPLLYVPGNHDQESSGPDGCEDIDGRVVDVAGLRVGGLGGCVRYRPGPHQYSEAEMGRRARRLVRHAGARLDVFVTHAPAAGLGEGDDPAHRGFAAHRRVLDRLHPRLMVHGHVAPYGPHSPDRSHNGTLVVNAIPHRIVELPS